jgi:hypothetical protein
LITAGVGAAATVAGAAISAGAANHASDVAANAAAQNNALQQQTYESNKALIQPAVDRGNTAADALQGFLGLGGDPAASQKAFSDYLSSTGYQFNRQQGLDAATQSKAAAGMLNSGAALKSLDAYGTGLPAVRRQPQRRRQPRHGGRERAHRRGHEQRQRPVEQQQLGRHGLR